MKKEKKASSKEPGRFYKKWIKILAVCLHLLSAAVLIVLAVLILTGQITLSKIWHYAGAVPDSKEAYLHSKAYTGRVFRQMQSAIRLSWQETIFETDGKLDLEKEILKVKEEDGTVTTYRLGDIVQAEVGGGFEVKPDYRDWEYSGDFWYWQEEEAKRTVDIRLGSGYDAWANSPTTDVIECEDSELGKESVPVAEAWEEGGVDYGTTNYEGAGSSKNEQIKVLWFACDRRYRPTYQEPETIEAAKTIDWGKHQIGWAVLDCLEQYLNTKKELQKEGHNFYYAFTGSVTGNNGKTPEEILALGDWYQIEKQPGRYEEDGNLTLFGEQGYNPYYYEKLDTTGYYRLEEEGDQMVIGVDTAFPKEDSFTWQMERIKEEHQRVQSFLMLLSASFLIFCLTLFYLIRAAGRTSRPGEEVLIRLNFFDKIPFELLLIVGGLLIFVQNSFHFYFWEYNREAVAETISTFVVEEGYSAAVWNPVWDKWMGAGILFIDYLFLLAVGLRLIRRKRKKSSCSLTLRAGRWLYQVSKKNVKLSWQTGLIVLAGAILFAGFGWLTGALFAEQNVTALLGCLALAALLGGLSAFLIKKAQEQDTLLRETALLAEGNLEGMWSQEEEGESVKKAPAYSGVNWELATHVSHIREGMKKAVEAAMKNERMKTELITNVSHDIKTPLTSIINYADLLRREFAEEAEETEKQKRVNQYLEVLDQKSKRLKVLTEDLVEASKASSGVLTITPEKINLVELVAQVNGEFEEKFSGRQLALVTKLPEEPVYILAEGRRVCRILENLYQNVFKYAMEKTRVYVEVAWEKEKPETRLAVFTIKNISAEPFSVSAEELTERFVRGDIARSSEGSGLGLSIARSLTELQKGTFALSLDGDLFRVRLEFPECS